MPAREIVIVPHPMLRKKAVKVTDFGLELQELVDDMTATLHEKSGIGLAAPQVNVSMQVILAEYGSDEDENIPPTLYITINPKITRFSQQLVNGAEGCLSIPGLMGDVERAHEIIVEGQDRSGKPLKMKLNGWVARIFQHEIDHLNGILFTDRTTQVWETDENYNPV
ncbi:MAG: peptide deformylase [Anaerolineales bacterium]|nr:MAG: peptide deformylase [Anaerolineales bacterium]